MAGPAVGHGTWGVWGPYPHKFHICTSILPTVFGIFWITPAGLPYIFGRKYLPTTVLVNIVRHARSVFSRYLVEETHFIAESV